jgi:tripartite-type tricarboxylate transporter receptor subunit TctC
MDSTHSRIAGPVSAPVRAPVRAVASVALLLGPALLLAPATTAAQPASGRAAAAERYPDRPIRLLVGFAPGGGADTAARPVAQRLAEAIGQQVVVDNRPGSSGNVAAEIVARASPDGYSVLFGTIANFAINPMIFERLTYDPVRDFAPVTLAAAPVNVVVVHPSVQASTMKELIALVRAKPNTINYGSSGIGGTGHLAGELMSLMGGLVMTHVPYKGGAPAVADLIGGNIPMVITVVPGAMPQVRANRARLLAVTTGKRSALLPDTPTIAESGLPGFEANNWYGVVVPAKTPQSIVTRLNTELVKVLNSPGLRETYANQGIEAIPSTPAEFTAYIRSEIVKWGKIVKAAGIKAD